MCVLYVLLLKLKCQLRSESKKVGVSITREVNSDLKVGIIFASRLVTLTSRSVSISTGASRLKSTFRRPSERGNTSVEKTIEKTTK